MKITEIPTQHFTQRYHVAKESSWSYETAQEYHTRTMQTLQVSNIRSCLQYTFSYGFSIKHSAISLSV